MRQHLRLVPSRGTCNYEMINAYNVIQCVHQVVPRPIVTVLLHSPQQR